jgi:hypothetical protein
MNLTTATPAQRTAAEIERITQETTSHLEFQLKRLHAMASDQIVLDAFGTNAVAAISAYSAFHAALTAVNPENTAPVPDTTVFQPQPDGSVVYVAAEPDEPVTEPEPDESATEELAND